VSAGWHNKLARVSQMSWDEIRTRAAQELSKRGDLLRHRMGREPAPVHLLDGPVREGNFFFGQDEATSRAAILREQMPERAAEIVRQADDICKHEFWLLGYEKLDYGAEIDWHLDRVHNKRAPLQPWFTIPFLDFGIVGDHKITWELNRHQHLVTLAKAWLLTGEDRYIDEIAAQWRSWAKANPYPLGINWGSSLEVAFRGLSWIWVDRLLEGAAAYEGLREELLPALAFLGRYIERYLSTYFSPNTHLLGEAVAMFALGVLYPQMPRAGRWKDEAWRVVVREAARQVRPDGVYFEQSLHYHVYALDFFLHARQLAAANQVEIQSAYDGVLTRMLDVIDALAQAGPAEGFGDDDGGRLFDPQRNWTENMTDPLAVGALTFGRTDLRAALTEESIWMFGERAVERLTDSRNAASARARAFSDGGLYVLADSEPCAQVMTVDAGPQGVGRCGHGHADALSLRLTMAGERWLVDSGSGVYIASDIADRNVFRGTAAHNTMRVDVVDQAIAADPFSWTDIPTTIASRWVAGKTFTYLSSRHNGYERLPDPVTHERSVLRVNGGLWLVRDVALGKAQHELEVNWHFAHDIELREAGAGEIVATRVTSGGPGLRWMVPTGSNWKTEITRGLLSPAYGSYQAAPVIRCSASVTLPAEVATVLLANEERRGAAKISSARTKAVQVYELQDAPTAHAIYFALGDAPWVAGPWSSDAEVLYCRIENDRLEHLVVIGGSMVAWKGTPLIDAAADFDLFEWRGQGTIRHSQPGGVATTSLLDELAKSAGVSAMESSYVEKH